MSIWQQRLYVGIIALGLAVFVVGFSLGFARLLDWLGGRG